MPGRIGDAPVTALHARDALELARVADLLQVAGDDRLREVAFARTESALAGFRLGLVKEDVAGWQNGRECQSSMSSVNDRAQGCTSSDV